MYFHKILASFLNLVALRRTQLNIEIYTLMFDCLYMTKHIFCQSSDGFFYEFCKTRCIPIQNWMHVEATASDGVMEPRRNRLENKSSYLETTELGYHSPSSVKIQNMEIGVIRYMCRASQNFNSADYQSSSFSRKYSMEHCVLQLFYSI